MRHRTSHMAVQQHGLYKAPVKAAAEVHPLPCTKLTQAKCQFQAPALAALLPKLPLNRHSLWQYYLLDSIMEVQHYIPYI